jgi:tRNA pseudouridine55 synthase
VSRTRRALGTRKVGHAGTLDPMATGLMILGVESSTRLLTYLVGLDKEYTATIRLGQATTTDDAEGEVVSSVDASAVTDAAVAAAIGALTGEISQIPSTFSAIKVDGRRAYDRARSGEEVALTPRTVTVSEFEVLDTRRAPTVVDLDVRVTVSSGTYVRALARDLGSALQVGGHLTALRRTRVGPFDVSAAAEEPVADALLAPATVASRLFPSAVLDAESARALAQGKRVPVPVDDAAIVAAVGPGENLVGLVSVRDGIARVLVNFPAPEPDPRNGTAP